MNIDIPASLPKTAVIGASGFIGSAFLSRYRQIYSDTIGTARNLSGKNVLHLDLLDPDIAQLRLSETGHKEALILSAISKIDKCEKEKEITRKVNVEGTLELIRQLVKEGIKPIFFSSDYVFDGITGNYADDAPTNPITEYGRQKAEVEAAIGETSKGNYLVVRLSKVFSLKKGDGSLLDEMAGILASGGIVRAAFDQIFCPTLLSDVVNAVAFLQMKGITGIVNVCSAEPWSRYDLALTLAKSIGIDSSRICRISLDDIGFKTTRPKNTSMIPKRLLSGTCIKFTPILEYIEQTASNWSGR